MNKKKTVAPQKQVEAEFSGDDQQLIEECFPEAQTSLEVKPPESKLISMVDTNQVMQFGLKLKAYINANGLSVRIQNTDYAMVDGWKFAGMNFGLVPLVSEPVRIEQENKVLYILKREVVKKRKDQTTYTVMQVFMATTDKEMFEENKIDAAEYEMKDYCAYKCSCEIKSLTTGQIVGTGFSVCTNAEKAKVDFDAYALASMAQTRAIGKAFRNLLGYVMKSAGYETTPAEEMDEEYTRTPRQQNNSTQVRAAGSEEFATIYDLLDKYKLDASFSQKDHDTIVKQMPKFTYEGAQKCIEWLTSQLNTKTI